ncbi:hypothetical protein D3C73_1582570 [compost metagenome]
MWAYRVSHPLLIPPLFIYPVIMTATGRYGSFVEFRMEKQSTCGILPTGRSAIETYTGSVYIRIPGSQGLDP